MKNASLLGIICWACGAAGASAGGFALEQQNAAAIGAAYAGAQAEPGDAGFLFYNPASLGDMGGLQISVNAAGVFFTEASYANAAGVLLGAAPIPGQSAGDGALKNATIPNISIGLPVSDSVFLGLMVNAPFGLNSDYARDSIIRYHALETDIKTISIAPAAAIAISPHITVGGALRIQILDFSAGNAIDAAGILTASAIPGFVPGTDDVFVALDAKDTAIGYQFGVQGKLTPRTRIGVNFTSKIEHNLEGAAEFEFSASPAGQTLNGAFNLFQDTGFSSALATPASISAGAAHDMSDAFTLKASAVYTLWNSFENIAAVFDNPAQPPETLTQDWKDSWAFSIGGDFHVSPHTTLRAGFMVDASPVNDTFASPRIPDADRYWINAGFTQKFGDRFSADFGAGYVFVDARRIAQPATLPENLFRGALTADYDANAFLASLRLMYRRN